MRHPNLLDRRTMPGPDPADGSWDGSGAWVDGGQEWRWDGDLDREPPHGLPEGARLGDFEIVGTISEGTFGMVYMAWDHASASHVAIKEYLPSRLASRDAVSAIVNPHPEHAEEYRQGLQGFVDEAQLLAGLDHPVLAKVLRHWEDNGTAYLAMPYYDGPKLGEWLDALGRQPDEAEILAWLGPLLDGLATLHAAGCVHRDVAPDNILLTAQGPVLLDFGAARWSRGQAIEPPVVFKAGFSPIEQYREIAGQKQGPWTDLYALAAIVYAAVAGETPQPATERLVHDQLEPLAQRARGRMRPDFLSAVDAALSLDPKDRPRSAMAFRVRLEGEEEVPSATTVVVVPAAEPAVTAAAAQAAFAAPPMAAPRIAEVAPAAPPLLFPEIQDREPRLIGPLDVLPTNAGGASERSSVGRQALAPQHRRYGLYAGIAVALLIVGLVAYQRLGDRKNVDDAPSTGSASASGAVGAAPPMAGAAPAFSAAPGVTSAPQPAAPAASPPTVAPAPIEEARGVAKAPPQLPSGTGPAGASSTPAPNASSTAEAAAPAVSGASPSKSSEAAARTAMGLPPAPESAERSSASAADATARGNAAASSSNASRAAAETARSAARREARHQAEEESLVLRSPIRLPGSAANIPAPDLGPPIAPGPGPYPAGSANRRDQNALLAPDGGPPIVPGPGPFPTTGAARRDSQPAVPAPDLGPPIAPGPGPYPAAASASRRDPADQARTRAWCTDILQRASLQPLTAGEVALLKSECK